MSWPVCVFYNILDLAAINAWIICKSVTGGKTSGRAFLHQLAEELREVYKEKSEHVVVKHNEEEQSQEKRKASKMHQCQVGMCKHNKTTEK
jgi:molybdenum-dependent DNA-binding transcriptional regulator ModE